MELIRLNETYTLIDATDQWNISGSVCKEESGLIKISISLASVSGEYLGSFNYNINKQGNININFDCNKAYEDSIFKYCDSLVNNIVESLK